MSTNGNGAPVTMPEWQIPRRHSQLSAAQRAKLTDDMVAAIQEQRQQINALTQAVKDERDARFKLLNLVIACQEKHSAFVSLSFWGRLKWFWTGR